VLQATLQREGLQHLHCFRQLPQQLVVAGEAVQQLMASDLLGLMRFQALPHLQDHLLAGIIQHQEYLASGWVSLSHHIPLSLAGPCRMLPFVQHMPILASLNTQNGFAPRRMKLSGNHSQHVYHTRAGHASPKSGWF